MKIVTGTFNGTGATVYVCCGFVPDKVSIFNMETSNDYVIEWDKGMVAKEYIEGAQYHTGTTYRQITALTVGTGISPYRGGDLLTATLQTSTTFGEGVYLGKFSRDVRRISTASVNPGSGSGADIDTWTLDTSANRTGHFNAAVIGVTTADYVAEGSRIKIDGKWYVIQALTSAATTTADYVELSEAPSSGTIEYITAYVDFAPLAVGDITPKGFKLQNNTVNADNALIRFEAIQYDD